MTRLLFKCLLYIVDSVWSFLLDIFQTDLDFLFIYLLLTIIIFTFYL